MRLIDADALILALQPAKDSEWNKRNYSTSRSEMIAEFCTELENWRTADVAPVVNRWIPVTERLPEESKGYIVCAHDGHIERVTVVCWMVRQKSWFLTGRRSRWKVTHWMPLPEPPKEDGK